MLLKIKFYQFNSKKKYVHILDELRDEFMSMISKITINNQNNLNYQKINTRQHFGNSQVSNKHLTNKEVKELDFLSNKQKWAIFGASTAGMVAGLGLCARRQNLNIFKWSDFKNLKIESLEILALASGSLIGGLAGGIAVDKTNKRDKFRETLQQFVGNIVFPISFVAIGNWGYDKFVQKTGFKMPQFDNKLLNAISKSFPLVAVVLSSLTLGIFVGNEVANKMNNKIFVEEEDRDIKITDLAAHVDDTLLGASLVAQNLSPANAVNGATGTLSVASRLIPPALVIPGYMAGIAQ